MVYLLILSRKRIKRLMENEARVVILTADDLTLDKLSRNGCHMRDIAIMYIAGCSERKNIRYFVGKNGRPELEGGSGWDFNISHTEQLSIVGISEKRLGIDVERVRTFSSKVVKKYYSEGEQLEVYGTQEELRNRIICEIWTRKEAHCKYTGEGICRESLYWDSVKQLRMCEYTIKSFYFNNCVITVCLPYGKYVFQFMDIKDMMGEE